MEIFKTNHFKPIKKVNCEKLENGKVYFKLSDYRKDFKSDRLISKPIKGSQINYHLTEKEAKNFIKKQLRDNIIKLKFQLEHYNNLLNNF